MKRSEWSDLFSDIHHLVVEPNADGSETYVCLPWRLWRHRGRDRSQALKERSALLRRFFSIWKTAWFINYDGVAVQLEDLSHDCFLTNSFHEDQVYGDWLLAFGNFDSSSFHQMRLARKAFSSQNEFMKENEISCTIFSLPDDIEWTIHLAKEL
jgi:hypothetical protein